MSDPFDELIDAANQGAVVGLVPLVRFDFVSGPKRYWPGFSPITLAGEEWIGTGDVGAISPISGGPGQTVDEMVFTLFGDAGDEDRDGILDHLEEDEAETVGREVEVLFHPFDVRLKNDAGNWTEYAPLAEPFTMFVGRMGPLKVKRERGTRDTPGTRIIEVRAQNMFVLRARPVFQFFSDRDQKARHPGDQIFSRLSVYSEGTVKWPRF